MLEGLSLRSVRSKLLFSFTGLTILTVGMIVFSVNSRLQQASEDKIEEEVIITANVLKEFRETQLKNSSDAAASLIRYSPQLRASLAEYNTKSSIDSLFDENSTSNEDDLFEEEVSSTDEGDLFGEADEGLFGEEAPTAEEKYQVLEDIVREIELFQQSQLFIITNGQGMVLYQKGGKHLLEKDISQWPVMQAALGGNELFTWWGRESPMYRWQEADEKNPEILYEVFFKPVIFGSTVVGVLIIGFDTTNQPALIKNITLSDVAFFQGKNLYSNSADEKLTPSLMKLASEIEPNEDQIVHPFRSGKEDFLALAHHVIGGLGNEVGMIVIFRSKTRELSFFQDLSNLLNLIGIAALIGGITAALVFSRGMIRAVRELAKGAEEVSQGNLEVSIPVLSQDELGDLAETFNKMTKGLKEKDHITQTFKKYVSSSVVEEVLKTDVKLGGERKEVTIYFSDLADFTQISEKLTPEDLISFLNLYLSRMTQFLEEQSGIVDKYIGDAIMAFWGAPLPVPNHSQKACTAAMKQLNWHSNFRRLWEPNSPQSSASSRIGIHTGEVIVGNVGSDRRLDYTIIGDSVNIASRLESLNKFYGTHVLISEAVHRNLDDDLLTREIDLVRVKGKAQALRIYELMTFSSKATPQQQSVADWFNEARTLYLQRQFGEALSLFEQCEAEIPNDPPSVLFTQRCHNFLVNPPPEDWDGVQTMREK